MLKTFTVFCAMFLPPLAGLHADQKPNIGLILCDDMGYADIGSHGCKYIPTLHIDRLTAGGMRFTGGHSSSGVCSPSRHTLLTGRYHWRSNLQSGIMGQFAAPLITPKRFTIANLAKSHG
jgi:arylsulfatase A